jgi:GTP-binding protein EngB required for normal cell division
MAMAIEEYIRSSPETTIVCLLVDARREPREEEIAIQELCDEHGLAFRLVATKADTLKRAELKKNLTHIKSEMKAEVMAVGSDEFDVLGVLKHLLSE